MQHNTTWTVRQIKGWWGQRCDTIALLGLVLMALLGQPLESSLGIATPLPRYHHLWAEQLHLRYNPAGLPRWTNTFSSQAISLSRPAKSSTVSRAAVDREVTRANRSETRVELLFDVGRSPSLSEEQRAILLARLGHVIDQSGVLRLVASESRSQHQNREAAVARFQVLLQGALGRASGANQPGPRRAAVERRLENKRRQAVKKRGRGRPEME